MEYDNRSNKRTKTSNYVYQKKFHGNRGQQTHKRKNFNYNRNENFDAEQFYNQRIVSNPWQLFEESLKIDQHTYFVNFIPQENIGSEETKTDNIE